MPPPLALLLCSAFVLFLLRLEQAESRGVSGASWVPTLWLMSISSRSLGVWLGIAPESNEAGSPIDQLFLVGLTVAGVAVVAHRRHGWRGALRINGWLLALLGYTLISTFWSDITAIALRRWVREAIAVVMALVVMSDPRPREALESVLRRSTYTLVPFSLLLIKYYPTLGILYPHGVRMWTGVTVHKNSLGCLCMISAFFLLWRLYLRWRDHGSAGGKLSRWADVFVLVIALFLLKGEDRGYSATAVAVTAVGVLSFLVLIWLRHRIPAVPRLALVVVLLILIALGASAPFTGGSSVSVLSGSLGRDDTLTGRTDVWTAVVPAAMQRPLFGYGFGSFWTTARREFYDISHGHNGYLDIVLDLGIVGLAFYVGWLWSCAGRLHSTLAENYEWASFGICILLMAVVYNTTEPAFSDLANGLTAVVVFVSSVVPIQTATAPILRREETRARLSRRRPPAPGATRSTERTAWAPEALGRSLVKQ
jgi:exopolysaccharide production protein ExoQ